jgi:hypothetical protein
MLISHNQNRCEGKFEVEALLQRGCSSSGAETAPKSCRILRMNLVTLSTPPYGDSEPRGELMGGQREDRRGSERQPVMGWIGPTRVGDTEPTRERGVQTSAWCELTREFVRNRKGIS